MSVEVRRIPPIPTEVYQAARAAARVARDANDWLARVIEATWVRAWLAAFQGLAVQAHPEACTTGRAVTRHLSLDLGRLPGPHGVGRCGQTLCGRMAYDEPAVRENRGTRVELSGLGPCRSCVRAAVARGMGAACTA